MWYLFQKQFNFHKTIFYFLLIQSFFLELGLDMDQLDWLYELVFAQKWRRILWKRVGFLVFSIYAGSAISWFLSSSLHTDIVYYKGRQKLSSFILIVNRYQVMNKTQKYKSFPSNWVSLYKNYRFCLRSRAVYSYTLHCTVEFV